MQQAAGETSVTVSSVSVGIALLTDGSLAISSRTRRLGRSLALSSLVQECNWSWTSEHSALRIPHSALRIPHSALRITHSALRTLPDPDSIADGCCVKEGLS